MAGSPRRKSDDGQRPDGGGDDEVELFLPSGEPLRSNSDDPRGLSNEKDDDYEPWLQSYDSWSRKLPEGWAPDEALSGSALSIVGHWKYHDTGSKRGPLESRVRAKALEAENAKKQQLEAEAFEQMKQEEAKRHREEQLAIERAKAEVAKKQLEAKALEKTKQQDAKCHQEEQPAIEPTNAKATEKPQQHPSAQPQRRQKKQQELPNIRAQQRQAFQRQALNAQALPRAIVTHNGRATMPVNDAVLGPAIGREFPRPRTPPVRDTADRPTSQRQPPPRGAALGQLRDEPLSLMVTVTVVVEPWCAAVGVKALPALRLDTTFTRDEFPGCTILNLHTKVVARMANSRARAPIVGHVARYSYSKPANGLRLQPEVLLAAVLGSDDERLVLNLGLRYSLPQTELVEELHDRVISVECNVLMAGNPGWEYPHPFTVEYPGIAKGTIRDILAGLQLQPDWQSDLSAFEAKAARVRLRDQANWQCIYDGVAGASSPHANQLLAPYVIAGDGDTVRLDIELAPAPGSQRAESVPAHLVAHPLLFIVRVDGVINREAFNYHFICRRGTQARHLMTALRKSLKKEKLPCDGNMYFHHSFVGGDGIRLDDDDLLRHLVPLDSPGCVNIHVTIMPVIGVLFWPNDTPSEASEEAESYGWVVFKPFLNMTVGQVKAWVQHWRRVQTRRMTVSKPALRELVTQWRKEDKDRPLQLRISGPEDALWRGYEPPLEDELRVTEIGWKHSYAKYPARNVRWLDGLWRREDEEGPELPRLPKEIPSKHNTTSSKLLSMVGTVKAPKVPTDDTPVNPPKFPTSSTDKIVPLGKPSLPQMDPPPRQNEDDAEEDPDDTWFSDASKDEAKSGLKVRCFRKGQRPVTYRTEERMANWADKTTDDLKREIIERRDIYKPNVKAPMLRIRRPGQDVDLPDGESLTDSLPGDLRQLLCVAGDWEHGFPPAALEHDSLAQVQPSKQEEPAKDVNEDTPDEGEDETEIEMQRITEGSGQWEDDFSDQSDAPEGPKKRNMRVRCFRKGYKAWTFRTSLEHPDTGKNKNVQHLTQQIINQGGYGKGGKHLMTKDLKLRKTSTKLDDVEKRLHSNSGLAKVLEGKKGKDRRLYCRFPAEEDGTALHTTKPLKLAGAGQDHLPREQTIRQFQPGDDIQWFSDDSDDSSDDDDLDLRVRCFCDGKAAHTLLTAQADKSVQDLKKDILETLDDFYPPNTTSRDLNIRLPTNLEDLHHAKKLRNVLEPPNKWLMCLLKNTKLDIPPRPPGGKPSKPKPDDGDKKGKRSRDPSADGGDTTGGTQEPPQKKSKPSTDDKGAKDGGDKGKRSRDARDASDDGTGKDNGTQDPPTKKAKPSPKKPSGTDGDDKGSDGDDENDSKVQDRKSPPGPLPAPTPQAPPPPPNLDNLPSEVLDLVASHLPTTRDVSNLRSASRHQKAVIDHRRYRTYCRVCHRTKAPDQFSRFDLLEGLVRFDEDQHDNGRDSVPYRTPPVFCLECGTRPLDGATTQWTRYSKGQGWQDWQDRVWIRCKLCGEVECVWDPKDDPGETDYAGRTGGYRKKGYGRLCKGCYEEHESLWSDTESDFGDDMGLAGLKWDQ